MTSEADFLSSYQYERGSVGDGFRDISKSAVGDCDDFAWTILKLRYGTLRAFLKAFFALRLVYSPSNKLLPRHVALKDKGLYIDSTRTEWRKELDPHKLPIPLGPVAWLMILRGLL